MKLRACAVGDLMLDVPLAVEVGETPVALVRTAAGVFALYDECSHGQFPLSDGDVEDGEIECVGHGARFDLRTGEATALPATEPVAAYPVTISGDDVLVDLSAPTQES